MYQNTTSFLGGPPLKKPLQPTKVSPLTSEPGGAVGFGRRRVDAEALAGQHAAVLGLLHQEAYLGQQPVQETRQHGCASDDHHVLGQNLPGVDGALRVKHSQKTVMEFNENQPPQKDVCKNMSNNVTLRPGIKNLQR